MVDDILDVTQTTEQLGKTAAKDLNADKTTYPKLFGLERSKEIASELIEEAKAQLKDFPADKAAPLVRHWEALWWAEVLASTLVSAGRVQRQQACERVNRGQWGHVRPQPAPSALCCRFSAAHVSLTSKIGRRLALPVPADGSGGLHRVP